MRPRLVLLLLGCLCALCSRAQLGDSIVAAFHKKARLTGGFSTRQTFIDGFNAPVLSAKIGADFDNKIRIGGGISFLKNPYSTEKVIGNSTTGLNDTLPAFMHLQYFNYYFEYVYFKTKKWEFSVPVEIGLGRSFTSYDDVSGSTNTDSRFVFVYQPVVTGYYKVTYWFGLGADVGYRFLLSGDKNARKQFSAPVYSFNTIIFWGSLYKKFFPESKWAKKI